MKKKYDEGGRIEVRGKKPSLAERAAGMAEEYGHGVGIPGIAGSTARAVGMARDLKQKKEQDDIIAKRKSAPEREDKVRRFKDQFDAIGFSEEPYKKGGKVGSASKRADGIVKKGKTRGKFV